MKKILMGITLAVILATGMTGCSNRQESISAGQTAIQSTEAGAGLQTDAQGTAAAATQQAGAQSTADEADQAVAAQAKAIVYKNTQFGFEFTLPASWKNYQIISGKWEGASLKAGEEGKIVETGPLVSIRHPQWTSENPRQDIPIMVFTLKQWDAMQKDGFHIGAAPINPSELGRNNKYVFALPARYNFAYPAGYEEVDKIIQSKALKPIEVR